MLKLVLVCAMHRSKLAAEYSGRPCCSVFETPVQSLPRVTTRLQCAVEKFSRFFPELESFTRGR